MFSRLHSRAPCPHCQSGKKLSWLGIRKNMFAAHLLFSVALLNSLLSWRNRGSIASSRQGFLNPFRNGEEAKINGKGKGKGKTKDAEKVWNRSSKNICIQVRVFIHSMLFQRDQRAICRCPFSNSFKAFIGFVCVGHE